MNMEPIEEKEAIDKICHKTLVSTLENRYQCIGNCCTAWLYVHTKTSEKNADYIYRSKGVVTKPTTGVCILLTRP